MKEIVEYTDYRKFIQDYYDERKRNSAFSWQEFARNAGFSSAVFLKYVSEGKKNHTKTNIVLELDKEPSTTSKQEP